ncbi:MAG: hypothetical protein IT328_05130 [Caldilineaceae bacterium]|nr:hypothetical protein [Caldilineaceae bacterium]
MKAHFKGWSLVVLAVLVVMLALVPGLPQETGLMAQDSPLTPTVTPTFTITPDPLTPSPTPTKEKRVVNELRHPQPGDAVAGTTAIIGTALTNLFNRYDVHVSPAGMENWQWLATNIQVIHDDVLYQWDTTAFDDGYYDIRVRAIDDSGNYTESFIRWLEVRNANPPTPTPDPNAPPGFVSPLVLPTPTPTPDARRQSPGGLGFYAPDAGAVIRGETAIFATAVALPDSPFARYELHFSQAGVENWVWLYTGERPAWQEAIYYWDTTQVADGLYDLRLRVVFKDSNYDEFFLRNLSVANTSKPLLAFVPPAGISNPRSGTTIHGVVTFMGTVPAQDLLRWELYWAPGESEQWQFLVTSEKPVDNGVLARLDLSQLPFGLYDFRLRVVRTDTNYTDYEIVGLRLSDD